MLQAKFAGREVDEPLLAEDGKTFALYVWCRDGSDYVTNFATNAGMPHEGKFLDGILSKLRRSNRN
jgi:hypothetical protein